MSGKSPTKNTHKRYVELRLNMNYLRAWLHVDGQTSVWVGEKKNAGNIGEGEQLNSHVIGILCIYFQRKPIDADSDWPGEHALTPVCASGVFSLICEHQHRISIQREYLHALQFMNLSMFAPFLTIFWCRCWAVILFVVVPGSCAFFEHYRYLCVSAQARNTAH